MADSNPTLCACGCGQPTLPARQTDTKRGYVKGQPHKFAHGHNYKKHGHTSREGGHSRTYQSWAAMLQRCLNPSCPDWQDYGRRGITVCEQWRSFEGFYADMGERPLRTSLDRYPNTQGNYEPGNARWATNREQRINQASGRTHQLTHDGKTMCLTEWAESVGLSASTLLRRYREGDRPPVLFRPLNARRGNSRWHREQQPESDR